VVFTDVIQFFILFLGNLVFLFLAVPQHDGWSAISERARAVRPEALQQFPPTDLIPALTVVMLVLQGFFFAGSPTAGEGMTAQRFMGAKNERHAIGGQLFNSFLALSLRTIPLIGLGVIALSLFWTTDLVGQSGAPPPGFRLIQDPAYAWGELVRLSRLPLGFKGVLVAAEAAAFMSTLSALINWGGSFIVNDFYRPLRPQASLRSQVLVSRLATLCLFLVAALVAVSFVEGMVSWFLFINSVMVIFILPLSWLRFFWWRFNVWGELAAITLGLPLSILFWFVLGFQNRPFWQSTGFLFLLSFALLIAVPLATRPESKETLVGFYQRCRPPGLWKRIRRLAAAPEEPQRSASRLIVDGALGIGSCLGLVVMTNSMFNGAWVLFGLGAASFAILGYALVRRVLIAEESRLKEG
jgi:Na+/proline symporter